MSTWIRLLAALVGGVTPLLVFTGAASAAPSQQCSQEITVHSGQTYVVSATTCLHRLTVEPGGTVAPPSGDSLTLTVNGVDAGALVVRGDGRAGTSWTAPDDQDVSVHD